MEKIKNPPYFGKFLHKKGFRVWTLYMFQNIEDRIFIEEPLHDGLFQVFQDIYDQKTKRQNINLPPRSAKTTMAIYFIAYCLAENPKCNFIYTSYSQDLLKDISQALAKLLQNPIYQAMYPHYFEEKSLESKPIDKFWEGYLKATTGKSVFTNSKITTAAGGVILFSSIGSALTGFGCFSFDTLVLTERGYLKLGDVVENKINVRINSYNFKKKRVELKGIEAFIKNDISNYLKITLDNGEKIECTTDHIFYTNHGQRKASELERGFLLPSNSLHNTNRDVELGSNIRPSVILIKDKCNLILRKIGFIMRSLSSSFESNSNSFAPPINTRFNIANIAHSKPVIFCYLFVTSLILCNPYGFISSNLGISIMSTMFYAILLIIGLRSINEIGNVVIKAIAVKVSNYKAARLSNKGKSNKSMNPIFLVNSVLSKVYIFISFIIHPRLKNFIAYFRKNIPIFSNKIPCKIRDREIIDIVNIHNKSSYCLTIRDNNNLFVTNSQVLVHNCGIRGFKGFSGALIVDDGNKPADIHSQTMRNKAINYFVETLLSRLNDSMVAIFNIQQRLHLQDLSGFLEKVYDFITLKCSLVINGICQLPSQYSPERVIELQKNEFSFMAQFQQKPIMEGGNLFKVETIKEVKRDEMPEDDDYDYRFITGDLSYKDKQSNDFTAFGYWGVKRINNRDYLYLIDVKRKKINSVDIEDWITPWIKSKISYGFRYIWIEDKGHGIYLNQLYRRDGLSVPSEKKLKETLPRDTDKVTRANNIIPCLDTVKPNLIFCTDIIDYNDLKEEVLAFPNGENDDFVDNVIDAVKIALFKKKVSIFDVV